MALFHPFRALGCITEAVPFAVQRRGRATFVTVSVGDAWQLYNCAKLTLVLVCQPVRRPGLAALRCGGCSPQAAVFSVPVRWATPSKRSPLVRNSPTPPTAPAWPSSGGA